MANVKVFGTDRLTDRQTDRLTDRRARINVPPIFFEKRGTKRTDMHAIKGNTFFQLLHTRRRAKMDMDDKNSTVYKNT